MPTDFDANNESNPPMNNDFDFETPLRDEDGVDEHVWDLLSLYVDGEATAEDAAEVEALLRANPAAAREFSFLKQAGASARTYVELEPPTALREAIFAATSHRPTLAGRLAAGCAALFELMNGRTGRYALAGGGLLAAGAAVVVMWPRSTGTTEVAVKPGKRPQVAMNPRPADPQNSEPGADNKKVSPVNRPHFAVAKNNTPVKPRKRPVDPVGPRLEVAAYRDHSNVVQRAHAPGSRTMKIAPKLDPNKIHHPQLGPDEDPNVPVSIASTIPPDNEKQYQHTASAGNSVNPNAGVDNSIQVTPRGADGETVPKINARVADAGSEGHPRLTSYRSHVDQSQLPPDPSKYLGNSDIKRERQAETMGYGRSVRDAIDRRQMSFSLLAKY